MFKSEALAQRPSNNGKKFGKQWNIKPMIY